MKTEKYLKDRTKEYVKDICEFILISIGLTLVGIFFVFANFGSVVESSTMVLLCRILGVGCIMCGGMLLGILPKVSDAFRRDVHNKLSELEKENIDVITE